MYFPVSYLYYKLPGEESLSSKYREASPIFCILFDLLYIIFQQSLGYIAGIKDIDVRTKMKDKTQQ